jgi:hypothetical protein
MKISWSERSCANEKCTPEDAHSRTNDIRVYRYFLAPPPEGAEGAATGAGDIVRTLPLEPFPLLIHDESLSSRDEDPGAGAYPR